jgi:acetylornithine deacetylase/succinyl-diaminopimelate desuccinylase-like protein
MRPSDPIDGLVDAYVDSNFERQIRFLAELVKVASDNPPGDCAPHARKTRELLEGLGFAVEAHPVPEDAVRAAGMKSAINLIARHRFGDGPTVALNAHGDVVPPGLGWRHDPYAAVVEDGPDGATMYGRGVAVSKSDFATYAFALLALQAATKEGAELGGAVELHFTYDEETGGDIGPKWLLEQRLTKPDFVIAAGFSYAVVTAHNGCLHLEVTVTGKQAHAAMPQTGIDALEAAIAILASIYANRTALRSRKSRVEGISSPTLNVGLIGGGINTNVVPDRISFRLDRRMIPEESPAEVEAELREQITTAARRFPSIVVEIRRILLATALNPIPGCELMVKALQRHARRILGTEVTATGVPLYTDARHYAACGIPTVLYGAGPRTLLEANAHNANENLRLRDLNAATRIVALAVGDLLRG